MENILYNISQVLGITILHSLWQGLLIYFILRIALLSTNWLPSSKRYMMAVTALFAITGWFAYTLINEIQVYNWLAKPTTLANMPLVLELPANLRNINEQTMRYYYSIEQYLPYVTVLYLIGLLLNSAKLLIARKKLNTIKRTMSLDVPLQQQMDKFTRVLNVTKKVTVGLSDMVDVPCITGYVKPVILLPFTLSTYLSAGEIESILLHELAHIKRNDYLINLLQQVITTLLFFNPCVLLINKIIGEERENSCDDLVVDATQNPVMYAKALYKLEESRQNQLQLALAVTGKKYHLLNRIERIMKTKKQINSIRPTIVAMLILTLSICSLALLNPQIAQGKISVKAVMPTIESMLADTIPAKKAFKSKAVKSAKSAQKAALKQKIKAEKAVAKNYKWNFDYNYNTPPMNDPELERLSKEVERHGNAISKYYDNPEFKATTAQMEEMGKKISAFYDSEKVKYATEAQQKAAADYEKAWGPRGEAVEKLGKQMGEMGDKMGKYYDSKEFKEMNERIAKKYGVDTKNYHNDRDDNYRKYQAELQSNIPADIKNLNGQMRKLGEEMRSYTQNPDVIAQREALRKAGEDMRQAMNNGEIKMQQEQMRKLGEQMRNYTQSDAMRKEQLALRDATAKMRTYMNTPEFKKKLAEYKSTYRNYNFNWDSDDEKPEKPEKAEKPEQPEKTEPAEKSDSSASVN